jgi:hypothetical protein
MARLRILTLISVLFAIVTWYLRNLKPLTISAGKGLVVDKAWLKTNPHPIIAAKDVRPPDQTFLTFPEWFLVFSPAEQAYYFKDHTSTTFPYQAHVHQLWKGYDAINDQIKGNYKFNTGYHVMIVVIAGSTTVEYDAKSLYETLIGRLTDVYPQNSMTAEDRFNAAYLDSYTRFIEQYPWYEYNFTDKLKKLWTTTDIAGAHFLRKAERRYYLTSELLVKAGYAWLIKLATKASYDDALFNTAVVVDKLPADIKSFPEIKDIKKMPDGRVTVNLPRYADFNPAACKLANAGVNFKEIAGNNAAIMLTVFSNDTIPARKGYKVIFTQPIVTQPGLKRIALATPVDSLSGTLREILADKKLRVEHIYDF